MKPNLKLPNTLKNNQANEISSNLDIMHNHYNPSTLSL